MLTVKYYVEKYSTKIYKSSIKSKKNIQIKNK